MTFGTINIFASSTTSGNATLTCNTTGQPQTFYACLSIGTGTGGTTASNRTLAFGTNKIPIQITGGASWPSQIGNGISYPMEGVVSFSVPRQSSGSYTFPLVVTIPTPSSLLPPGTYASTFTGTDFQVYWDTNSAGPAPRWPAPAAPIPPAVRFRRRPWSPTSAAFRRPT